MAKFVRIVVLSFLLAMMQACGNLRLTPSHDEVRGTEIGNGQELQNDAERPEGEPVDSSAPGGSGERQGPRPGNGDDELTTDDDGGAKDDFDSESNSSPTAGAGGVMKDGMSSTLRLPAPYDATQVAVSEIAAVKAALIAAGDSVIRASSTVAFADLDGDLYLTKAEVDAALAAIDAALAAND